MPPPRRLPTMRASRLFRISARLCLIGAIFCVRSTLCAQQAAITPHDLPEAPRNQNAASLDGFIEDQDGSMLPNARVQITGGKDVLIETSDEDGHFHADGLLPGAYSLRVQVDGFDQGSSSVELSEHEQKALPPIALRMQADASSIRVVATQQEIAAAQVSAEEKQRVLGVLPNFYVTYFGDTVPLKPRQKFHLAWRSAFDPMTFVSVAAAAGIEQAGDDFPGYGQGSDGYAKRYGAAFADSAISTFLGGALLPTLFRQDPRYFYMGKGSFRTRAYHAISSVVICPGDNGRKQFNASNVLGNFASAGISNLYYPSTDRHGAGLTLQNAALGTAFGAFGALMQEFVVPWFTPHLPVRGGKTPRSN